jgi:hypothetical protein
MAWIQSGQSNEVRDNKLLRSETTTTTAALFIATASVCHSFRCYHPSIKWESSTSIKMTGPGVSW